MFEAWEGEFVGFKLCGSSSDEELESLLRFLGDSWKSLAAGVSLGRGSLLVAMAACEDERGEKRAEKG